MKTQAREVHVARLRGGRESGKHDPKPAGVLGANSLRPSGLEERAQALVPPLPDHERL
jgi:hypothetical protein